MRHLKYKIVCAECKKEINCSQPNQKLCSEKCRDKYYCRGYLNYSDDEQLSSGTAGAISELKVATKFLKDGYAIFRSLSPSCFCDLVAIKKEEIMYIEVRTGYLTTIGSIAFPKKISTNGGHPTHYAIYIRKTDEVRVIKI